MMSPASLGLRKFAAGALLMIAAQVSAEAVFDGSVGPQGALSGDMVVDSAHGSQVGGNLFHSFTTLNVNPGETLTFTSSFAGATDNVISRVTGTTSTLIDGPVWSTIPGASLWLINPNGMVFGPGAFVDVQGGFHASTADYLLLDDGGTFGTDLSLPGNTVLTMGNPASFGFLTDTPASIEVDGPGLFVPYGETLELVAGDITVSNAFLGADGGTAALAGVAAAGEVSLTPEGFETTGEGTAGNVSLVGSNVVANGDGGGAIFIRAGQFVMDQRARIEAQTFGPEDGRGVHITADDASFEHNSSISTRTWDFGTGGPLEIDASGSIIVDTGSALETATWGPGQAGAVRFRAGEAITITGVDENIASSYVRALSVGDGAGGEMYFAAPSITVSDGAIVWGSAYRAGPAAHIVVDATESLVVTGSDETGFGSQIVGAHFAGGDAATIDISGHDMLVSWGASVGAFSTQAGRGGDITIDLTGDLTVEGNTQIESGAGHQTWIDVTSGGTADSGTVNIRAASVNLIDGGIVVSSSFGAGSAGAVNIEAGTFRSEGNTIGLKDPEGYPLWFASGVWAVSESGEGASAGAITVRADDISIGRGSGLFSRANALGGSGDITLEATESITLGGEGRENDLGFVPLAEINAESNFNFDSEQTGGSISITAPVIDILEGGLVTTYAAGGGRAGDVDIHAGVSLTASAGDDAPTNINSEGAFNGASGNINLSAPDIHLSLVDVLADISFSSADGGVITITADNSITLDNYAFVSSVTYYGERGGDIFLTAPEILITDGARVFTDTFGSGELAGDVYVSAGTLDIRDRGSIQSNSCFCAFGDAGSIYIDVDELNIVGQGVLTGEETGLLSEGLGSGLGGNIVVNADTVTIDELGVISAASLSTKEDFVSIGEPDREPGDAGSISITARRIDVTRSFIETNSVEAAGGSIDINVSDRIYLDNATLSALAEGVRPDSDGGNITIADPKFIILADGNIVASANAGTGGNILLTAGALVPSAYSTIDASSQTGVDGRVVVEAPNDLVATTAVLDAPSFDVSEFARDPCEIRVDRERSSFTIEGQGGVPASPDDYLPSPTGGDDPDRRSDVGPVGEQAVLACR